VSATFDRVEADLVIRELSLADLPAILEIEHVSYSTPWRQSTFESLFRRHDTDLVGVVHLGRLIGFAIGWTIGDQAELGNIAVEPRDRGQGTGKRLVEAVLERVRARGARECFLEVRESNTTARELYDRFGFQQVGRRRNYYTKPTEDALVMRRDII